MPARTAARQARQAWRAGTWACCFQEATCRMWLICTALDYAAWHAALSACAAARPSKLARQPRSSGTPTSDRASGPRSGSFCTHCRHSRYNDGCSAAPCIPTRTQRSAMVATGPSAPTGTAGTTADGASHPGGSAVGASVAGRGSDAATGGGAAMPMLQLWSK